MMQLTIPLIYDIALAVLVLLVALRGKHRGLLAGLMSLAGTVAGFLGAVWATRNWAPVIYNDYLGTQISQKITEAMEANGGDIATALQGITLLPAALRAHIITAVQNVSGDVAPQIVAALEPVLLPLIQAVLFIVVVGLVRWVFGLLSGWLRSINGLPVLGVINQVLGFAFGFVTGVIDCWLVCLLLWLAAAVTMGNLEALSEATLNQSRVYAFFAHFNPFLLH